MSQNDSAPSRLCILWHLSRSRCRGDSGNEALKAFAETSKERASWEVREELKSEVEMSNRHFSRTLAMQTLYEWDFSKPLSDNEIKGDKVSVLELVKRNLKEFAPEFDDEGFAQSLIFGVFEHRREIDEYIERFAPEWPIGQITVVDRNILRLGIFELIFGREVPAKVAINEAIELAKTFGGESSGRFVNGVLGAIYKNIVSSDENAKAILAGEVSRRTGPALSETKKRSKAMKNLTTR